MLPQPALDGEPAPPADLGALALHNYGHFTTMRVSDLRVRGLTLHLERLVRDCRVVFDVDLDAERVRELVRRAVAPGEETVVRVTVFAPDLDIGDPAAAVTPRILVSTRAAGHGPSLPIRLGSVRYHRELPAVKHTGFFGPVHHRRAARLAGSDDAVFVDDWARLSEGPTWNIGFVDGERVVWPTADCLPGITAALLEHHCGIPSVRMPIALADLADLRAGFVTNAVVGVRTVESVDSTRLRGDEPFLDTLRAAYAALPGDVL